MVDDIPKVHPVISILLALPAWPLQAYALHLAWTWFAVSAGAPDIGYANLLGLVVTLRFALWVPDLHTYVDHFKRWKDPDHTAKHGLVVATFAYVWPAMVIAIGYVIHLFV